MGEDDEEKKDRLAEEVLGSFGFGGLLDLLKKSEVFQDRFDEINERIKDNLEKEGGKSPKVDFNFDISSLKDRTRGSRPSSRPRGGRSSSSADSFRVRKQGDSASSKDRDSTPTEDREPLVDIFESPDSLRIVALFPDANEEDLTLSVEGSTLLLTTPNHRQELQLPSPVDDNPEIQFKNGIFDIMFDKA